MVDSATPANFKSGISPVDTAYYKDGAGAWTSLPITDTATEIGSTGVYEIDLTASELNHDLVFIKFSVSGAADTAYLFNMVNNSYVADAVWDEPQSGHNTNGTTGKALRRIYEGLVSVEGEVNDVSATTTSFITNLTETTTSHYGDLTIVFLSGTLQGQARLISLYNGTTKTLTVTPALTEAPANGDSFVILTTHVNTVSEISTGVREEMDSNSTQLAAIVADTGTTLPALIAAQNDVSVSDILTTQMTESYAADGVAPTLAQAIFLIQQKLGDFAISGSTITVRKLDGAAVAATYTLDDDTNPTASTRTT
jgi:hypothetical protein